MVTLAVVYVVLEWRLRRVSRWRRGALDHADRGVVLGPLVVFLVAALVLSTGGWDLLRIPGVLTVLGLPIALGAAFRALRREPTTTTAWWRWQPTVLAVALSLLGLVALAVSR